MNPFSSIFRQILGQKIIKFRASKQFPNTLLEEKKFFLSHANYTTYIENYVAANPETRVITLRRDLRDLCVFCAVFVGKEIDQRLGRKTSFDEK